MGRVSKSETEVLRIVKNAEPPALRFLCSLLSVPPGVFGGKRRLIFEQEGAEGGSDNVLCMSGKTTLCFGVSPICFWTIQAYFGAMNTRRPVTAKIMVGAEGLGTPDQDLVQKRAWEVAEIEEHDIPTSSDWDEARRELHGRGVGLELSPDLEGGERLAETLVALQNNGEDPNLGEELIREGMEEAEHERMLMARKPEIEPTEI